MQAVEARISLSAIVKNASLVAKAAGVPLIAVVKDDAYGHGAERVALALRDVVASFAVATVREGAALRVAGVTQEILVLTPALCAEEAVAGKAYGLTFSVSSFASLNLLGKYARGARAHLAVNTGMNRYGVRPERTEEACRAAKRAGIGIEGVYSHLYLGEDGETREEQRLLFSEAAERVRLHFPSAVRHLSATAGLLCGKRFAFDAARCGIALYGYLPAGFGGALPVRPAMKFYATVSGGGAPVGGGAGYGKAERNYRRLYTVRLGYGDGFFRAGGIGIGKLCMDACIREGSAVFGQKRLILSDVSGYARAHGTTEYEALVALSRKAEKVYV